MSYAPFRNLLTSPVLYFIHRWSSQSMHLQRLQCRCALTVPGLKPVPESSVQMCSTEPTVCNETGAYFAPMHVLPRSARAIIWPTVGQIGPISERHILYGWSWLSSPLAVEISTCQYIHILLLSSFLLCFIYPSPLFSKLRLNTVFKNKPLSQALLPEEPKPRYYCIAYSYI